MKIANIGKGICKTIGKTIGNIIGNIWATSWRLIFGLICLSVVGVIGLIIWILAGVWLEETPFEGVWKLSMPIMVFGPTCLLEVFMMKHSLEYGPYLEDIEGDTITRRVIDLIKKFARNVTEYWRGVFGDLVACAKTAWANPVISGIAYLVALAYGWITWKLQLLILNTEFYSNMDEWLFAVVQVLLLLLCVVGEVLAMSLTWRCFSKLGMIRKPRKPRKPRI